MRKAIDDRDIGRVRTLIVKYGLPEGEERVSFYFFFFRNQLYVLVETRRHRQDDGWSLRGRMWCLILNVKLRKDDEKKYNVLVQKGRFRPKNRYGSISVDVPRTFASDKTFSKRVPQAKLELPEVLAFRCMRRFAGKICPGYMQKGNPSAHKALELLKNCMSETADGVLRTLQKHIPIENPLYTIAFSPLLSFSASLRPLDEIRYLWDFILLFGTHLNILFVLGYILTQSEDIMKAGSANEIQRMFDPRNPRNVHSRSVVNVAFKMLPNISPELYDALKKHSDVVA